jgi:glutamate-ammonia-ligase adenylyltransferase
LKIDRHREADSHGFNVKLHRGGIREIEFIAQALQLAHGGHDDWLRAPHTLISLGRLADRNLIFEHERTELSDAYFFLRKLEHRLQMEHGLQTHTVPGAESSRTLVARRMDFSGGSALADFDRMLAFHTGNVRRAFDRVFQEKSATVDDQSIDHSTIRAFDRQPDAISAAARIFSAHLIEANIEENDESLSDLLRRTAAESSNPQRALTMTSRVAASVDKTLESLGITRDSLVALVQLCAASEFFAEILAGNPSLMGCLIRDPEVPVRRDFRSTLRAAIEPETTFSAEMSALRRQWLRSLVDIGRHDAAGEISVAEANRLQTELAMASLNVAFLIARRELARRFGRLAGVPRIAILGLGRLSTFGVDYGSDLDVVVVYDSLVPSPIASLTREEAYARLAELMIAALSNVTREGYLYRVDMRLRPNGQSGPLIVSSEGFLDYARQRADIWEWLAYVKLRAIAGDLELGKMVETHARHAIHERAQQAAKAQLQEETRRVRERLEAEKAGSARQNQLDIKYGAGGMLDIYFAVRYLQLLDDIPDEGDERSTQSTLERLQAAGSLGAGDYADLSSGYALLRSVDHQLRVIVGKSTRLPATDHAVTADIAARLGFNSAAQLREMLLERMAAIRAAYLRILGEV